MVLFFNTLAIGVTLLLAWMNYYAIEHALYFEFWWYDAPMHFLGGAVVGFVLAAGALRMRWSPRRVLPLLVLATAVVGVGWELLEYAVGLVPAGPEYWPDTLQDLLCDALGAGFAYLLFLKVYRAR